jgi:hypothetical protein
MADILSAYTALSASSPRSDAAKVLNSVINGSSTLYDSVLNKLKQPIQLQPQPLILLLAQS